MTSSTSITHAEATRMLGRWQAPDTSQAELSQACLASLAARPDATRRTCTTAHLTASAVVLSHDLTRVARVLHGIVGAWLAPGGHIEDDDASLRAAPGVELRVSEESRDVAWWPVDALPEGTFEEVRLLIAAGRRVLREK